MSGTVRAPRRGRLRRSRSQSPGLSGPPLPAFASAVSVPARPRLRVLGPAAPRPAWERPQDSAARPGRGRVAAERRRKPGTRPAVLAPLSARPWEGGQPARRAKVFGLQGSSTLARSALQALLLLTRRGVLAWPRPELLWHCVRAGPSRAGGTRQDSTSAPTWWGRAAGRLREPGLWRERVTTWPLPS